METRNVEGIGSLKLNPTARTLQIILTVVAFSSLGIMAIIGFIAWTARKNGIYELPLQVTIPGMIALLLAFVCIGLAFLTRRRFYPGDFYMEIERDAANAKDSAQALLKLTGVDATTHKLKAKAHLYLAYKGASAHWAPLIELSSAILDQEPDNLIFRLDRAQAHQQVKNYDAAVKDLEIVLADADRLNLRAHSIRISCLTSMNRLNEARLGCDQLENLIERFPNRSEIPQALAAHRAEIRARE